MRRRAPLRRGKGLERRTALRRSTPLRPRTPLRRAAVGPASPAQRAKVAGRACLVCGQRPADPAHLVPRSLGGCDHPDCVAPLCRRCHRAYDRGQLDLLPHLEPGYRTELAHGLQHLGLMRLLRRLTGSRWAPLPAGKGSEAASPERMNREKEQPMTEEPLSAASPADATDRALEHAHEHLERLGYRLLEDHLDWRGGTRLLVACSQSRRELVFCELRAERLGEPEPPAAGLRRRRLRRAALAWLAASAPVDTVALRFDRLTVFVGRDGIPVGLEHTPQAF